MEFNQPIEINQRDILGFGIRIDGLPVAVGINLTNGRAFKVNLNLEDYRSLKASVLETEPDNFIEKDQFYNTANGYTEVYLRTKH